MKQPDYAKVNKQMLIIYTKLHQFFEDLNQNIALNEKNNSKTKIRVWRVEMVKMVERVGMRVALLSGGRMRMARRVKRIGMRDG